MKNVEKIFFQFCFGYDRFYLEVDINKKKKKETIGLQLMFGQSSVFTKHKSIASAITTCDRHMSKLSVYCASSTNS